MEAINPPRRTPFLTAVAVLFLLGGTFTIIIKALSLWGVFPVDTMLTEPRLAAILNANVLMGLFFLGPVQLAAGTGLLRLKEWGYHAAFIASAALFYDCGLWLISWLLQGRQSLSLALPIFALLQATVTLIYLWDKKAQFE